MASTAKGDTLPTRRGADESIPMPSRWGVWLAALIIVLVGLAAYSDSLNGPFIFDDLFAIRDNPTIRGGWLEALNPPSGALTVTGRPLVNLSLAINYGLGGFNVWGYHLVNLAIHLLAGLTLFGLARRTLRGPVLNARFGSDATTLAGLTALLWTVHPLQTESVTYVVQRAESLMGLFYLLTLYCFARAAESPRKLVWPMTAVLACLFGMLTKEVMVTAPLMVLLYDRTFCTGTFAEAWRRHRWWHVALACTWVPLAWQVISVTGPGTITVMNVNNKYVGLSGLSPGMKIAAYGLTQCKALVHYLRLAVWPHPLVLDYGTGVVTDPLSVAPQIAVLALLLAGVVYALWRRPALGFLGAWFFVILAPTSSVIPLAGQPMAEHHLYLSLAALVVLGVLGLRALLGRSSHVAGMAMALGLCGLTFQRNHDYRTGTKVWGATTQALPDSPRARLNLSIALVASDRLLESLAFLDSTLRIDSDDPYAENDLGNTLMALGRIQDAITHYLQAIKLDPQLAEPDYNLGNAYHAANEPELAREAYLSALRLDPNYAAAHSNLGSLYLVNFGSVDQAIAEYEAALRTDPNLFQIQVNLGNLYIKTNRAADAIPHYTTAIKTQPDDADAYAGLGFALLLSNRANDALPQFETATRLAPGNPDTHNNFGLALLQLSRYAEAARQFEETLHLDPSYLNAQNNLDKSRQLAPQSAQPPGGPDH